jgi:hypothetical protein
MSLAKKTFATGIALLAENFHFTVGQKYSGLIFDILKSAGVEDDDFKAKVQEIILTKTKSEFSALPSAADWLEMLNKKRKALSIKDIVILECCSVLEEAKKAILHKEAITFQNKITNAVVQSFGGLKEIQNKVFDKSWVKSESFFKREFEETWIAFHKVDKISEAIFGTEGVESYDTERYSTIIDGIERTGDKKINIRFLKNPKRIIPDLSQSLAVDHKLLPTNKIFLT